MWLLFRALTGLGLARPKGPDGSISQKLGQLLAEPPSASATSLFRASDDGSKSPGVTSGLTTHLKMEHSPLFC